MVLCFFFGVGGGWGFWDGGFGFFFWGFVVFGGVGVEGLRALRLRA